MESSELKSLRALRVKYQQEVDAAKTRLDGVDALLSTYEGGATKAGRKGAPKAAKALKTRKARQTRVDQSEAVIGILKKAGKPLGKQEIVKALGKAFKPNSWNLTIASAKKGGVKQHGQKAGATYSV